jgi:hypothetical protein
MAVVDGNNITSLSINATPNTDVALALQAFDPQPEHGRGLSSSGFPLVDHGLAGCADLGGQLLLAGLAGAPDHASADSPAASALGGR